MKTNVLSAAIVVLTTILFGSGCMIDDIHFQPTDDCRGMGWISKDQNGWSCTCSGSECETSSLTLHLGVEDLMRGDKICQLTSDEDSFAVNIDGEMHLTQDAQTHTETITFSAGDRMFSCEHPTPTSHTD